MKKQRYVILSSFLLSGIGFLTGFALREYQLQRELSSFRMVHIYDSTIITCFAVRTIFTQTGTGENAEFSLLRNPDRKIPREELGQILGRLSSLDPGILIIFSFDPSSSLEEIQSMKSLAKEKGLHNIKTVLGTPVKNQDHIPLNYQEIQIGPQQNLHTLERQWYFQRQADAR